jgi:hypothetical protein
MSRAKKYRLEVDAIERHPGDNDHYALAVEPPLNRDDVYCRINCQGRTWGGSSKALETRDAAIEYIHERLERLEEKALDDKYRGVTRYPEPPKPANTRYVVHPDYEGEIGPREVWGDATLSTFGAGAADSQYAETPWYQHREAYDEWLAPLREDPGALVYRVYAKDIAEMAYFWYVVDENDQLFAVRYRPESGRLKGPFESSCTSATRRAGGIGITNAPPADCQHLNVDQTPFANGVDGEAVTEWIETESPPALAKADANQVDKDGDHDE